MLTDAIISNTFFFFWFIAHRVVVNQTKCLSTLERHYMINFFWTSLTHLNLQGTLLIQMNKEYNETSLK